LPNSDVRTLLVMGGLVNFLQFASDASTGTTVIITPLQCTSHSHYVWKPRAAFVAANS